MTEMVIHEHLFSQGRVDVIKGGKMITAMRYTYTSGSIRWEVFTATPRAKDQWYSFERNGYRKVAPSAIHKTIVAHYGVTLKGVKW